MGLPYLHFSLFPSPGSLPSLPFWFRLCVWGGKQSDRGRLSPWCFPKPWSLRRIYKTRGKGKWDISFERRRNGVVWTSDQKNRAISQNLLRTRRWSEEGLLLGIPRICQGLNGGHLMYQVKRSERFLPPKKYLNPKHGIQIAGNTRSGIGGGGGAVMWIRDNGWLSVYLFDQKTRG